MNAEEFVTLELDKRPPHTVNGRSSDEILQTLDVPEDRQYNPCPEAFARERVASGNFERITAWDRCIEYPKTTRNISIYCSAGVQESSQPPAFAFFNDGEGYAWRGGQVRATHVLDNLVHDRELPPIVAAFVNPGAGTEDFDQRSFEYDSVNSKFVTFIQREIVPLVEEHIGRQLSQDPSQRLVCGISSGGICAFNAAWHAPECFGLVLSHCGSFVNILGGHNYPSLIRRTPRKPIRVCLQSGKRDAVIIPGNWPIANQDMAAALEYAGYDYRFEFGEGGHSLRHGGAIFADSLRWLFQHAA